MLRKIRLFLIIGAVIGFISCQKDNISVEEPIEESPTPGSSNVNKATLLQLVNNVRELGCTCGNTIMPPVASITWNEQLATASFTHSNDMFTNNYFSHTGLNGSSAGDRITAAGYFWRAYGENIAKGYTTEQSVMAGWLKSEGHCKNIMSGNFREMGVARTGNYWAQEFGSR